MHTVHLSAKYLTLAFIIFLTGCNSNSGHREAQKNQVKTGFNFLMEKI